MADTDPAIVGVQPCGCVTFALSCPRNPLRREDERALRRIERAGGRRVHTTVAEARAMPHFLVGPDDCPHRLVTLHGGDFDGREVWVTGRGPLLIEGDPLPDGIVARYRPSRERGVYRFRELDRIALRVPAHEQEVA